MATLALLVPLFDLVDLGLGILHAVPARASYCSAADWAAIRSIESVEQLRGFAVECRETPYGVLASEELRRRDHAAYLLVDHIGAAAAYRSYLLDWPEGEFTVLAQATIETLEYIARDKQEQKEAAEGAISGSH